MYGRTSSIANTTELLHTVFELVLRHHKKANKEFHDYDSTEERKRKRRRRRMKAKAVTTISQAGNASARAFGIF